MSFENEIEQLRQILGGASEEIIVEYTGALFWEGVVGFSLNIAFILCALWVARWGVAKAKRLKEDDEMDEEFFYAVSAMAGILILVTLAAVMSYIPENVSQMLYPKAHAIRELVSGIRGQ